VYAEDTLENQFDVWLAYTKNCLILYSFSLYRPYTKAKRIVNTLASALNLMLYSLKQLGLHVLYIAYQQRGEVTEHYFDS